MTPIKHVIGADEVESLSWPRPTVGDSGIGREGREFFAEPKAVVAQISPEPR